MLGAIIGDIVGSTREWHNIKTEDFELIPNGSHFTDDTVMTLAVAEWLMLDAHHSSETLVACMQRLGRRYPNAGYGHNFNEWIWSNNPQPYHSFGNGSGMRVSPVGLYAQTLKEALELARITASVTHNHPEGIKGAQAIAASVFLNKYFGAKKSKTIIRNFVSHYIKYNLHFDLVDIRPQYSFDVTCQGSVPIAIKAFLEGRNFSAEHALRLAISMGGDSDTIGAMTTAIADAERFGASRKRESFPSEIVDHSRGLLPPDLLDINDRFETFLQQRQQRHLKAHHFESQSKRTPPIIKDRTRDRIRGSLIGGAIGDALGYPVEFMSRHSILQQHGYCGITSFSLSHKGKALISDDTQMTLFTANGLLWGITHEKVCGEAASPDVYAQYAYLDWYYTQGGTNHITTPHTWLYALPELAHLRAPGNTCLSACDSLLHHHTVANNSKGCGGLMRVAPMALLCAGYWVHNKPFYTETEMNQAGADIAAVTHKHPLGFLPAAMLTHFIYQLMQLDEYEIKLRITELALDTIKALGNAYKGEYGAYKHWLGELTEKAVGLAHNNKSDDENIRTLGEGWVAEEAWAIALYCVVRHIDNVEKALIAAVNHDGDSDSTGAICGNIMGAIYGYEAMKRQNLCCPRDTKLEQTLELAPVILSIADDLYANCLVNDCTYCDTPEKQQWFERYCHCKAVGI